MLLFTLLAEGAGDFASGGGLGTAIGAGAMLILTKYLASRSRRVDRFFSKGESECGRGHGETIAVHASEITTLKKQHENIREEVAAMRRDQIETKTDVKWIRRAIERNGTHKE